MASKMPHQQVLLITALTYYRVKKSRINVIIVCWMIKLTCLCFWQQRLNVFSGQFSSFYICMWFSSLLLFLNDTCSKHAFSLIVLTKV